MREEEICEKCGGTGYIEVMGDGDNFEFDVIDTKVCKECEEDTTEEDEYRFAQTGSYNN